jgi:hypothetical protein
LVVWHHPNPASGGRVSETELANFLSQPHGPQHQALQRALETIGMNAGHHASGPAGLTAEVVENLSRSLGRAVARCWSNLPQESQKELFEAAVSSDGEAIREQLAIFLHGKHERTLNAVQTQALQEPDSLGG